MRTVEADLDLLQLASRPSRCVGDALSTLLKTTLSHMESVRSLVWLLFIDFSPAFSFILPRNLAQTLRTNYHTDHGLLFQLVGFLKLKGHSA